jgi:YD repeat-containing protein
MLFAASAWIAGSAQAGTPSYIGPYKYQAQVQSGGTSDYHSTEDAARDQAIARGRIPDAWCGGSLGPVMQDWAVTYGDGGSIEGAETGARKTNELYYSYCTGSGLKWTSILVVRFRTVCSSTQKFLDNKCVNITPITRQGEKGANVGPSCPHCGVGQPINPSTGNMWHTELDYAAPGASSSLSIRRVYNSSPVAREGSLVRSFGTGWTHQYDSFVKKLPVLSNYRSRFCYRRDDTYEEICEWRYELSGMPEAVAVTRPDGKSYVFQRMGLLWNGEADTNARLTAEFDSTSSMVLNWNYVSDERDIKEKYDANGLLLSITARSGGTQQLTYSTGQSNDTSVSRFPANAPVCSQVLAGATLPANRLLCVTDNWGRQLNFNYDEKGRVIEIKDPANQSTVYEYDGASAGCLPAYPGSRACGANNLTKVTYPDGKSRNYFYNEASRINNGNQCTYAAYSGNGFGALLNAMTGLVDENGARHISWTYRCIGDATSSQLANGVEKVTLSYSFWSSGFADTTISHTLGDPLAPQVTTSAYKADSILGVIKHISVNQPCAECGPIASRTYDANGNVKTATDFNGAVTSFDYDMARNLETSRVEASGTAVARTITTAWHPNYRLPTQISEPKRLTTYTHDANGNVLTRTEQATTDLTGASGLAASVTGAARTWTYTYNTMGQLTTVTGPRSDVASTTTYVYDASGNLTSVTNALGHVTTLSNYDAHGRVGVITAPNGVVTGLSYTPRGWLASRTVSSGSESETTTYDYDGAGQLKKATMPDGTWVNYTYDDAHRLTNIADSLGNSVAYTLDLTGNRMKEKVSDPGGALRRQISRVFDTMNRLKEQTGGGQ